MTSTGRAVGGIISLISGILLLIYFIISQRWTALTSGYWPVIMNFIINTLLMVLILVGGIMALAGKKAGGILALLSGLIIIVLAIVYQFTVPFSDFSWLTFPWTSLYLLDIYSIHYITIEGIIAIIGGIIAVAGGED